MGSVPRVQKVVFKVWLWNDPAIVKIRNQIARHCGGDGDLGLQSLIVHDVSEEREERVEDIE